MCFLSAYIHDSANVLCNNPADYIIQNAESW